MNRNQMQVFCFEDAAVRTIERNGEPWFVGKDVAEILGYAAPRNAIRDFCKGGIKSMLPTGGGLQEMTIIPERDLYRLIMRSKLPAAERFEEWVVAEVLPAIRKTGFYNIMRRDPEWQGTRHGGKFCHRLFTDVIREFVEYARKQDSRHADQYFVNYTRMIYRELGIAPPAASNGVTRDFLDVLELSIVSSAEMVCVGIIKGGIAAGKHYRQIFQDTKVAICDYARKINPARQLADNAQLSMRREVAL
ncbi:BRO-N domain-containing protein [Pelobacter propionicus]|uniref:BRO domain protein n=1 Tax=Pelobacter propionicus (strain DSM 2379 / NBRC 103807 / OttBd1) TaxID=338966 RepID=A1AN22_PELPD|nr:Bro-N domain-containing protein [Pelobacter propionicus]ABK98742.1 BRO domain protein [Pelobacter propionicus DSM 2379]